jgi:molecular chaperone GrpE
LYLKKGFEEVDMMDQVIEIEESSATAANAEVAQLKMENGAIHDRMLRALADSENTRNRADRSVADAQKFAISGFARELLAVADNLERAVSLVGPKQSDCDAALIEGVLATQRLLTSAFERFNVRKIPALGAKFDPAFHEALTQVEDSEHEPGTIIQVFEEGYMINDRLLRAARVVIAKRPLPKSSWHH